MQGRRVRRVDSVEDGKQEFAALFVQLREA